MNKLLFSCLLRNTSNLPYIPICMYSTVIRQSRIMNKILNKSVPKRKSYNHEPVMPSPKSLSQSKNHGKTSLKRIAVLNKLFMKHITDLMATGAMSDKLLGRAIEISHVKVCPDFKLVNVYWLTKGMLQDCDTEKILVNVAMSIRHELSQLKVIGVVPRIAFVKDTHYAKFMELDVQLAKADFGDDHVPSDPSLLLKSEFVLNSKIDQQLMQEIKKLELNDDNDDVELPPMRHDIFGLDRSKILKGLNHSLGKSRDAWSKGAQVIETTSIPEDIPAQTREIFLTPKEQKQRFTEFLKKRRLERDSVIKLLRTEDAIRNEIGDPAWAKELPIDPSNQYEEYDEYDDDDEEIYTFNDSINDNNKL